jgi:hypothetical protein
MANTRNYAAHENNDNNNANPPPPPTLEQDIQKGQLEEAKIQEIKEQIKIKPQDSVLMRKERYGTRSISVFPK